MVRFEEALFSPLALRHELLNWPCHTDLSAAQKNSQTQVTQHRVIWACGLEACATSLVDFQVFGHQSGSDEVHCSTMLLEGLYSLVTELGKIVHIPEKKKNEKGSH